jgi:murein DD-endopeptidase MepM/ murein hydrolase activator NlpD
VNDKLVYLPVAPERVGKPASGMVAFALKVRNNQPSPGQGKPKPTLKLKSMSVSLPESGLPARVFPRDTAIAPEDTATLYLTEDESIRIPAKAPPWIQIGLTFEGFAPWTWKRPLAAHVSPTPEGSYAFPFKVEDLKYPDVLIEPNASHAAGPQHFAYDIHAIRYDWKAEQWRTSEDGGKTNNGTYIFGTNFRAVADGIVLSVEDKWQDNPRPGGRRMMHRAVLEQGSVGLVSIAGNGGASRIFTAVTDADKRMQLRSFVPSADASTLTFEGQSAPGLPFGGKELSLLSMSTTRAVTARAFGGAMALTLWKSSKDGATITSGDSVVIAKTEAAKIEKLSANRIVMARQPVGGGFAVSVWDLTGADELPPKAAATATVSGPTALFDVAVLSETRFVTAVQTAAGKLKVIVGDISVDKNNATKITVGKAFDTGENASQIAVAATKVANQFAVATRTTSGKLKLYYFDIAAGGDIALTASRTDDDIEVTLVSLIRFKSTHMATAVRMTDGTLRFIAWSLIEADKEKKKPAKIDLDGWVEGPAGDITALALTRLGENRAGAAIRTTSGKLKVVLFQAADGNGYNILHGNEVVSYVHLEQHSLPHPRPKPGDKVKKGAVLGRAGHSGSSSGPHLHIQAAKVTNVPDVDQNDKVAYKAYTDKVIKLFAAGKLQTAMRPMPFHGVQATLRENVIDGDNNWFVEVVDQGFYFKNYAIYPAAGSQDKDLPAVTDLKARETAPTSA